ncbi:TPA: ead/Ea22-like family protein [Raoultella ornithinolytica]|nr:ead/Ea22-like family protein [Raoultella ornithinolytica]
MTTDITELAQLRAELSNPAIGSKDHMRKLALSLVEALEKAQQYAKERDEENQDLMLTVGRLRVDREELESRTVKLPKPHAHLIWIQAGHAPDDYWDDVAVSHSEKDRCCDGSERYPVYAHWEIEGMLTAAGIKMEVE